MSSVSSRPVHGQPLSALLWDLDNVSAAWTDMGLLAQALCGLVEPGAPRVAAANWRAFRSTRVALRARGIKVICGGHQRDGADGVLLHQARRLRKRGVERFFVASNDHTFARIARSAELHVLTLTDDYVSRRLRAAACSVTVLTRDADGWRPKSGLTADSGLGRALSGGVCAPVPALAPGDATIISPKSLDSNASTIATGRCIA